MITSDATEVCGGCGAVASAGEMCVCDWSVPKPGISALLADMRRHIHDAGYHPEHRRALRWVADRLEDLRSPHPKEQP